MTHRGKAINKLIQDVVDTSDMSEEMIQTLLYS